MGNLGSFELRMDLLRKEEGHGLLSGRIAMTKVVSAFG